LAAELFRRHGYHGVGVNDIAAAAGITGPALYRHFTSKQALLSHVLRTGVDGMCEVADRELTRPDVPANARLSALNARLAEVAVEHRAVSALWRWEGLHLPQADAAEIRKRGAKLIEDWSVELRLARPELTPVDAELRCWAALSAFGSVADHRVSMPKRRFGPFLAALADGVLATPSVSTVDAVPAGARAGSALPTKREQLLTSATALFRQRGFHAVSVEDIGQACGMAAASVYRHFPSKTEMLTEACKRMADRLAQSTERALSGSQETGANGESVSDASVTELLESYVDTVLRQRDLLSVYVTELANLPARERTELIRLQRAYVAEWASMLGRFRGDLDEPAARVAVHTTLTIVNDLVRTERLAVRPGLAAELVNLGNAVLRAPAP
jgi:AcrR family transcriptional regulator